MVTVLLEYLHIHEGDYSIKIFQWNRRTTDLHNVSNVVVISVPSFIYHVTNARGQLLGHVA